MFVTHFGSAYNGAIVWWDNTTSTTTLTAYMYVSIAATPLIVDSFNRVPLSCAADDNFTICDTQLAGAGPTTVDSVFAFGLYWENPDSDAVPLYDGMKTTASLTVTAPADFAAGSFVVECLPTAGVINDINATEAEDYTTDDANDDVTIGVATDLCTEWWTLDYPRMACVSWYQEFSRLLNTADSTDDMILEMDEVYTFTAFAGAMGTAATNWLPTEDVDFTNFTEAPVLLGGMALACSVSCAVLTAILF